VDGMLKLKTWFLAGFLTFQILQGCSSGKQNLMPSSGTGKEFVETELYFGLCKNDVCASENDFVSDQEWTSFLEKYVAPRFTDRLTVIDSTGRWMNKSGKLIQEKSKIIILVYPSSKKAEESIERIQENYKALFHQESVIKINHTKIDVSF
jgi:hypothetical protein